MGARGAVIPVAKRPAPTLIGRSTQARPGAGIEVGVPHAVARRTRPITEIIEVGIPDGLPRSPEGIEAVEGRVAGLGVGVGLHEGTLAISRSRRMRNGMRHLLVDFQPSPRLSEASSGVRPPDVRTPTPHYSSTAPLLGAA